MSDLPILRTSERRDFKRCPTRWQWAWREGLKPNQQRSIPLWFGTIGHLAMQHWYVPGKKRGRDPRETFEEAVKGRIEVLKVEMLNGDSPEGSDVVAMEAGELGEKIFTNYLDTYGEDPEWEIISPEETFAIIIPRPGTRDPIVQFSGTFDVVARNLETGKLWLWDHKFMKTISTSHLDKDDQAGGYFAVAPLVLAHKGLVPKNTPLAGVLYNFVMKSPPDERPKNEHGLYTNKPTKQHYVDALTERFTEAGYTEAGLVNAFGKPLEKLTAKVLAEIAEEHRLTVLGDVSEKQPAKRLLRHPVERTRGEVKTQLERIGSEAVVMDLMRRGELPLYKTPTKDCSWDCDFKDLCSLHERGGDIDEYIEVVFHQEDPYADHRRSEKEAD